MGWFSAGVSTNTGYKNSNERTAYSGSQNAILSDQWNNAFGNTTGNLNAGGANSAQQQAMDFAMSQIGPGNPATAALYDANGNLQLSKEQLQQLNDKWNALTVAGPRQLGAAPQANAGQAIAGRADTAQADYAPSVMGRTAASGVNPYRELYGQELVDPALAAYDYGTDRAFSALDARTAGGGGFANSRSGLGYSDLASQSAMGRGQLVANLKNMGLTNAIGAATGDANRFLTADTSNAGNKLSANLANAGMANAANQFNAGSAMDISKFNAGQNTQNNQFNTGVQNQRDQFNVGAGYQGDQQNMQAITAMQGNLAQQAGLTQQQAQNIVTGNGINVEAANALFQAGQITQAQLAQITQLAQSANGQTVSGDSRTDSNSWNTDLKVKAGFI